MRTIAVFFLLALCSCDQKAGDKQLNKQSAPAAVKENDAELQRLREEIAALKDDLTKARAELAASREEKAKEQQRKTAKKISAGLLFSAYVENEIAADAEYEQQLVEVTGKIEEIATTFLGAPYVLLHAGDDVAGSVQCMFDYDPGLKYFKKGQEVTVRGVCSGKTINVVVMQCEFVR